MESLTQKAAEELMHERGYSVTSLMQTGGITTGINFVKNINGINLHAKVVLNRESIDLSCVDLQYLCCLNINSVSFYHKDLAHFEQVILMYAAKCQDIDVFETLKALQPAAKEPVKTIEQRKIDLQKLVKEIAKKRGYPIEECKKFHQYWTQINPGGKKMQFEITKAKKGVFDVGGRLATWFKNNSEWEDAKKTVVEKKTVEQDNKIKETKIVDHKKLFS